MIRGAVNAQGEAVVRLRVRGSSGIETDAGVIVDSGFTSSLTLPSATVAALGLARQTIGSALLADGSALEFDVYAAEVAWDGGWRPVTVYALGDQPLLGMQLMAGHRLHIDVVPGGAVAIAPLP